MRICVGSKKDSKVGAVKEAIREYDFLSKAEVISAEVVDASGVSEQPRSMDETIRGAMNRAKAAFVNCDYSVGIEDGLMKVPHTKTDYMNICACAIYDGRECHIGLASAYEYPREVIRLVIEEGLDINQAFHKAGLTENPKIGGAEGAIGVLTHGRLLRKDYAKQAVVMALIHLENSKLF
jgi:inosine/xanthosine triphosphatase